MANNKSKDREVIEGVNDMLKNIVWYGRNDNVTDEYFRNTTVYVLSRLQGILDRHLES